MKTNLVVLLVFVILSGCGKRTYQNVEVDNPPYHPNTIFQDYEDLTSPGFSHMVEKFQLDTIFHGETDEFKRILLLRHWIKSVIKISDFEKSYPGEGNPEFILDAALKGQGFHCGHYMSVQNAVLNAYGYVTRTIGAGPGVKGGPDGHHGINEVWLNQYNKWFLSDAKYDHHFEKQGIPLSALEIREEFLKNNAADIVKVKGPQRIAFDVDAETGYSKVQNARTYTWIEWHGYNDPFTRWPVEKDLLIMYEDDFFKNNTWIWGGKPHWAYAKPEFMKLIQDPNEIYWTPNTIVSQVEIDGKLAHIRLESTTPNLKEYQVKELPAGEWNKTEAGFKLPLKAKRHELLIRTVNLAGVTGPEHRIILDTKE
ncbi:MAG TPA: transglutaminase-like domain-containing protein [Bacteroidales bacterium]|nr:transglutaminase-like domain-containing protein [Bacteroidales bacterium]HPR11749.1 transglutaminase-like domain-containing protein [Bacteroidales bacterium]